MNLPQRVGVITFCIVIVAAPCLAADKGILQGYVRDKDGQPVKGAWIAISTGSHIDNDAISIPIIGKNTVGTVGVQFPPSEQPENFHYTYSDKSGHYRFRVKAYRYSATVRAPIKPVWGNKAYIEEISAAAAVTAEIDLKENLTVTYDFRLDCNLLKVGSSFICEKPGVLSDARAEPNNATIEMISSALHRALLTATEKIPFGSIAGSREPEADTWKTTLALHGADSCQVALVSATRQPMYSCRWSGAQASYDRVMAAITSSGDWSPVPGKPIASALRATTFRSDLYRASLMLTLGQDDQVFLIILAQP